MQARVYPTPTADDPPADAPVNPPVNPGFLARMYVMWRRRELDVEPGPCPACRRPHARYRVKLDPIAPPAPDRRTTAGSAGARSVILELVAWSVAGGAGGLAVAGPAGWPALTGVVIFVLVGTTIALDLLGLTPEDLA